MSFKGGFVVGDLFFYEVFVIGGMLSVCGYNDGVIGMGCKYVVGSVEMCVSVIFTIIGAAFFDYGSDLYSGGLVFGDFVGMCGKFGSGYSYGVVGMFEIGGLLICFDYVKND